MSNAMWGGRFASGPDAIMEEINASIDFDKRLAAQDIRGSKAHAAMLAATGIISDADATAIRDGSTRRVPATIRWRSPSASGSGTPSMRSTSACATSRRPWPRRHSATPRP